MVCCNNNCKVIFFIGIMFEYDKFVIVVYYDDYFS